MKNLELIFDFGSPNAYLVCQVLPELLQRTQAELKITPVLLGGLFKLTNNQAPMIAFGNIKNKMDYEMLETKRFIEKYGLSRFQFNPHFPINTITIMRGLIAAQEMDIQEDYMRVVLAAMWETGQKMDDAEVVLSVLNNGGLDGKKILDMTQTDAVKEKLKANTQDAADRGAFGIPTFFVDGEMFFGKERLQQVEEELKK